MARAVEENSRIAAPKEIGLSGVEIESRPPGQLDRIEGPHQVAGEVILKAWATAVLASG